MILDLFKRNTRDLQSEKNGNVIDESIEKVPQELRRLSDVAIKKQVMINENFELLNLLNSHFLRAFNGSVNDVHMIKERAEAVQLCLKELDKLLGTITKPYLD